MTLFPRIYSVRLCMTLWYALAIGVALSAYAGMVYLVLRHTLSEELDRALARDIEVSARMLELKKGRLVWDDEPEEELSHAAGKIPAIEVVNEKGKVLFQSDTLKETAGQERRFARQKLTVEEMPVTIHAAQSTEPMRRELALIGLIMILGVPLTMAIAGLGGYLLARRALAPVGRMVDRARAISAERLSERLPVDNPNDELGRLALVFNDTFSRLQESFEQLRRFTADASHELRTPLTAIRSVGEVGLSGTRGTAEYREIIGSMLEEADRLSRLVDCLLTLSRADGGQVKLHPEKMNLAEIAGEVVQQLSVLAEEKKQSIRLEGEEQVAVDVDHLVIRQALINLVDNAIKYGAEESSIRVAARSRPFGAIVEVVDNGPGIATEHLPHIFERFYRVDKARTRQMGGAGLGLSIALWAVKAHGGKIEVESEAQQGSLFRIILPVDISVEAMAAKRK